MVEITVKNKELRISDVKGIIFDKDGTLTDSDIYWSEIIKRRSYELINSLNINKKYFDLLCQSMGLDIQNNKLLPEGPIALKTRKEVILEVVKYLESIEVNVNNIFISNIFKNVHNSFKKDSIKFIKPIPSAYDFVQICKKNNLQLALITSDTELNAKTSLKQIGLEEDFEIIIGGDSRFGNKSNGNAAKFACQRFNLNPQSVIAIGDAPSDFYMYKNGNLKNVILVESGQLPIASLKKLTKYSINNLSEIFLS